ncbi:N-methylhydantoinase A/acetone carboxylase subunit beta [Thiohalobacter thiocyanaticus]|uniref:N-methylhydantoinase A/acetone carboxylase subunit beta n=1 Tax=Thiohalobacter thiocyanaticus TaxID=585455 RepID=A0A1Z4VVH6_9GAMM|nr:hydantoinase/oxoprolinase family protein [Thiohalobacter thiocyanaticus]BAZ95398.1 N-methylhydantoinase A/acetone carboxylase subunit beta [Thiohalobacter thiocyanaticus]
MSIRVGIDTGGTFTDFVVLQDGRVRVHKVLSTPDAPERAILQGLDELGLAGASGMSLVHGSTVATNAVLEAKGVKTVYITNRGLGDVLAIGRQARAELYNLQPEPVEPPLPPEHCLETGGRRDARGKVITPLTDADLAELKTAIERLQPRAVAINLLFAFLDGEDERRIAAALPADLFVSCSSEVLPEIREYERGMATFLNAHVGPLVEGYLQRLKAGVAPAPVAVMQSAGGLVDADQAARHGVHLLLSGPAGGLRGAGFVGRLAGCERLLSFDMGGTSTDVALIEGEPRLTTEGRIGRYPVAVPMVDMHTIGAGGGSIARVDAGGMLLVGPESAGAAPGPACYGRGGTEPTVTDANLVLGRLRPEAFLDGGMRLDAQAARMAVLRVAEPLGLTPEAAAAGIVRVANEHMARALRVISVQRGLDPRDYVLTSFGGAGGLHVCALAEALGMRRALVPVQAGVLSALGMLSAAPARQLSRAWPARLEDCAAAELEAALNELAIQGGAELAAEGLDAGRLQRRASLDLCYEGQSFVLTLLWEGIAATAAAFHAAHEARYGHRLARPVALVNLRLEVAGPAPDLVLPERAPDEAAPEARVAMPGLEAEVPVHARDALGAGQCLAGPALITETVATTWLAPGWRCEVDRWGNLLLTFSAGA